MSSRLASSLLLACACAGACASPARRHVVRLALGGDTIFGRWKDEVWREFDDSRDDETIKRLAAADVAIVNLETGLCDPDVAERGAGDVHEEFRLTTPPSIAVEWLRRAGVDVAVIANNHSLDCGGPDALAATRAALEPAGVTIAGITGEPATALAGEVVVVAATEHAPPVGGSEQRPDVIGPGPAEPARFVAEVARARAAHPGAILVASLHWGTEGAPGPDADQRELARRLVDAGADVVFGHGAHVLQPVEHDRGATIVWSAGDLRFDRPDDPVGLVELSVEPRR